MIKNISFSLAAMVVFILAASVLLGMNIKISKFHCDAITASATKSMEPGELDPSQAKPDLAYFRQESRGWPESYWSKTGIFLSDKREWIPIYFSQHGEQVFAKELISNSVVCLLLSLSVSGFVEIGCRYFKVNRQPIQRPDI